MLALETISKRYGKKSVLTDVSQAFETGINLLTGPSGAGKSTLLRLCATVERPTSGKLTWNGTPLPRATKRLRRHLGYAPQAVDLPEDLTGLEFMQHMAALKGVTSGGTDQARTILSRLGLSSDEDQRIRAWSGGMRRRLILAQAFLGHPNLLVLDEPTAELDTETAIRVADLISASAPNAVILLTTHLQDHFAGASATLYRVDETGVAKA